MRETCFSKLKPYWRFSENAWCREKQKGPCVVIIGEMVFSYCNIVIIVIQVHFWNVRKGGGGVYFTSVSGYCQWRVLKLPKFRTEPHSRPGKVLTFFPLLRMESCLSKQYDCIILYSDSWEPYAVFWKCLWLNTWDLRVAVDFENNSKPTIGRMMVTYFPSWILTVVLLC